jgi:hypothetical protein
MNAAIRMALPHLDDRGAKVAEEAPRANNVETEAFQQS